MNTVPLQASKRQLFGKGAARKLRGQGLIPAVIYRDGGEALHISIDPSELRKLYRRTQNINSVLELDVEGEKRVVLLKDHDVHPVSRDVLHADFFEIRDDERVVVQVPVKTEGRAKGMGVGGKLQVLARTLKLSCLPKDIPAALPIDIAPLDLGDMIQASQVVTPEGCELLFEQDFNVVAITGRRAATAAEEEAEAAEAAAE